MGRPGAFLQIDRKDHSVRAVSECVQDYREFNVPLSADEQCEQASRCMSCGVAFCQSGMALSASLNAAVSAAAHDSLTGSKTGDSTQAGSIRPGRPFGCPLQNLIPETNDLLYRRRWDDAVGRLFLTNPFPEFTSRVCPSPCEAACNLGLNKSPVSIHDNERALADYAWEQGICPLPHAASDAPLVSIIGSGPAGLACAWELTRLGKRVRVYERAEMPGGLLMFGIPSMKLPKSVVEARIELMRQSGIEFICNVDAVGQAKQIKEESDAVVIATGCTTPRALDVKGSDLPGIVNAVDYLSEVTRAQLFERDSRISAKGKDVVVIGGGDTGVDCVACAIREGAKSVHQIIRAQKPVSEQCATCDSAPYKGAMADPHSTWPYYNAAGKLAYGQREAYEIYGSDPRLWSTDTIGFTGCEGVLASVELQEISYEDTRHLVEGTEFSIPAQLVLIAKGFVGPELDIFKAFGVANPQKAHATSFAQEAVDYCLTPLSAADKTPVYVAGDARLGSSLVASAMADALACARQI